MTDERQTRSRLLTAALVVVTVAALGALAMVAVSPAAANHGDDAGNYTVVLPEPSDHLPGDQNEANASMQNFAQAGPRFEQEGAPNGFETLDYLETGTPEIDYSQCDSPNTAVFGIDRGNNNSGTQVDEDLLEHMKDSRFKENKIEVDFYEEDDFGGDPTHINPEDAIVSVQGAGSAGGPCFTMPTERGWYQVNGLVRGTTEDGEVVEVESTSHYFPICDGCHDEDTAREELGAPPSEEGSSDDSTPTPTATDDEDDGDTDDGDDETTATPTATDDEDDDGDGGDGDTDDGDTDETNDSNDGGDGDTDDGDTGEGDTDDTNDSNDGGAGDAGDGNAGDGESTPTPGDGPGFTGLAAVFALLATALLAYRRN